MLAPRATTDIVWSSLKYAPVACVLLFILYWLLKGLAVYYFNPAIVTWRAESISGDKPYCIQVAADNADGYRAATSLRDLEYVNMQANKMVCDTFGLTCLKVNNHALLVLNDQTRFMNWSYRWLDFREEYLNAGAPAGLPRAVCAPIQHFAQGLR